VKIINQTFFYQNKAGKIGDWERNHNKDTWKRLFANLAFFSVAM
jgi:hypothetical protein